MESTPKRYSCNPAWNLIKILVDGQDKLKEEILRIKNNRGAISLPKAVQDKLAQEKNAEMQETLTGIIAKVGFEVSIYKPGDYVKVGKFAGFNEWQDENGFQCEAGYGTFYKICVENDIVESFVEIKDEGGNQ